MLLCDAAQVADGKLYILGGGWSLIGPDPMPSAVALKIDVDWTEVERAHHWELYLLDEDGQPIIAGSPVDVALALNFGPLPLKSSTRYNWRLAIDGESQEDWSLAFSTRPPREA